MHGSQRFRQTIPWRSSRCCKCVGSGPGRGTASWLCVFANGDGIVPRETATFPYYQIGSSQKALLEVGTRDIAMAHADLFISRECHERVFVPVATWLGEAQA